MSQYFQSIDSGQIRAILVLSAAAMLSAEVSSYSRSTAIYTPPDVKLVDETGKRVRLRELLQNDVPVLLQFVFTSCTSICPVMSGSFSEVQKTLGTKVRMISISIDPENDTPAQLAAYGRRYHGGPSWTFLTGAQEDIAVVAKSFHAYRPSKMEHRPLTFLRGSPGRAWVRLEGLTSAADLLSEYRKAVRQ